MLVNIHVAGVLMIVLSVIHIGFPKYFKWKNELEAISLVNRQMLYMHTFFLALSLFLTGCLCVMYAPELINNKMGKAICVGLGVFWFIRLLVQFIGYSTKLWKGKAFETTIHILFSMLWLYLTVVFFCAYNY